MNIYRVRFITSEIFYIHAATFSEAVQKAIDLGMGGTLTSVKYIGVLR